MTEPHSRISILPLAQVTSTERNKEIHILIPIPVEYLPTLFLHTLGQIVNFLNVEASDINASFGAVTLGALA